MPGVALYELTDTIQSLYSLKLLQLHIIGCQLTCPLLHTLALAVVVVAVVGSGLLVDPSGIPHPYVASWLLDSITQTDKFKGQPDFSKDQNIVFRSHPL